MLATLKALSQHASTAGRVKIIRKRSSVKDGSSRRQRRGLRLKEDIKRIEDSPYLVDS